jgi:uncharacterized protein (TIGR04255 family)
MNDISFKRAPVVELITELRWQPEGLAPQGPGAFTFAVGGEVETYFMHFGGAVAKFGYTQAERIVPAGVPSLLHHVVWRFRKPGDGSTLLQVGPGIFSANALQPYRRWSEFRPVVEQGLDALLETRIQNERALPFSGVSLRYMNAFQGDLLAGQSPVEFIRQTLGLKVEPPPIIAKLIDPKLPVAINTNMLIPIANTSKVMSVTLADGQANNEPAAIFDVTVSEKEPVPGTAQDVLGTLNKSRDIIHDCFLEMTKPINKLMQPAEL